MTAQASVRNADPALEVLKALDAHAASLERADLARLLQPVVERLEAPLADHEFADFADAIWRACRVLHAAARSRQALPLARALLAQDRTSADRLLHCRSASTCGILYADVGDPVSAIEHHVVALRLAQDRTTAALIWNNIGLAMSFAGHSAMATRCYERALGSVEGLPGPLQARYIALINMAQSQFDTAAYEEGLVSACLALRDESPKGDPMEALWLRRNLVRLFVAVGRVEGAEPHVLDAANLAQRLRTPRATIAASLARAVYDLARGDADVGLTRLDAALALARGVPAALRETLGCVVRAEEMAGHSERALLRLGELSDLLYGPAVAAARQHIEIASIADREHARGEEEQQQQQARARLISKLGAPRQPDGWSAFERLAVTAGIRVEPSGLHGKRVGALAKALAMASGTDPLRALEIGFACELHDIGMVSVSEEMLSKKTPLPEVERSIVERHVRAGAEILSGDDHPRIFLAREVVRYHHAHWDGSGYPEGVAGTRIPFAARVCAVADAYDDFVCGLRGRPRQTMDDALQHLRTQAGKRYDPELVACFESMIRAETDDLGLDLSADLGMENFQHLVKALQEDRGFV